MSRHYEQKEETECNKCCDIECVKLYAEIAHDLSVATSYIEEDGSGAEKLVDMMREDPLYMTIYLQEMSEYFKEEAKRLHKELREKGHEDE